MYVGLSVKNGIDGIYGIGYMVLGLMGYLVGYMVLMLDLFGGIYGIDIGYIWWDIWY